MKREDLEADLCAVPVCRLADEHTFTGLAKAEEVTKRIFAQSLPAYQAIRIVLGASRGSFSC